MCCKVKNELQSYEFKVLRHYLIVIFVHILTIFTFICVFYDCFCAKVGEIS